eukprot:CAMPEP_0194058868 /NCGR_PEP_ID=MMETSP0009_2-20130614/67468_1 /TAXON_ID=210454 /ORGANISM="Grammatophora oceanica, Strain CCMP 410" /LENGTH=54 /DNA_ID=CAMNT_0038709173 /DNA_START=30 /DNA_END=191 /DNA_ORIENTATION=+
MAHLPYRSLNVESFVLKRPERGQNAAHETTAIKNEMINAVRCILCVVTRVVILR